MADPYCTRCNGFGYVGTEAEPDDALYPCPVCEQPERDRLAQLERDREEQAKRRRWWGIGVRHG